MTFELFAAKTVQKTLIPDYFSMTKAGFLFSETLRDFSEQKRRFRHAGLAHTYRAWNEDNVGARGLAEVPMTNPLSSIWACPHDYREAVRDTPFDAERQRVKAWGYKRQIERKLLVEAK